MHLQPLFDDLHDREPRRQARERVVTYANAESATVGG
jgi:hypothetical protein